MRKHLLGAACVAAFSFLGAGAALAAPASSVGSAGDTPQVTISGDYSYIDTNVHRNINDFGGSVDGATPLGASNFSFQGDASYHDLTTSGVSLNQYLVAGGLSWRAATGRIGANVSYSGFNGNGVTLNFTSYGVYGEWYASEAFTVGLKGGGATVGGGGGGIGLGHASVGYVGAEAVGYLTPDFAVNADVDYLGGSGGNLTTAGVGAEYLFSHATPISVFGGYTYDDLSGLRSNTFTIGAKYYFGGSGSLVDHQRSGVDNWGPLPSAVRFLF